MRTKEQPFLNWTYTCDICKDNIIIKYPPMIGSVRLPEGWEELTFCRSILAHVCPKQECKEKAKIAFPEYYYEEQQIIISN